MPAGPEESGLTDHVAEHASSKTETNASDHPIHGKDEETPGDKVQFRYTEETAAKAHQAAPGPAVPENFSAQQEGTKEERKAKAEALNK